MNVAKLFSPKHDCPVKVIDPRRYARRAVRYSATVAAKSGLADGVVTNISETGCDLQLVTSSFPKRYLSLKLFTRDWLDADEASPGLSVKTPGLASPSQRVCKGKVVKKR